MCKTLPSKVVRYCFNGKLAGPCVTEPSVIKNLELQQLSNAVMLFVSTETNAHVFEGSKVQCLSNTLNSSLLYRYNINPLEPPFKYIQPPGVLTGLYAGSLV